MLPNSRADSFIYGPDGLPVEQINNTTGAIQYLHHDQQGSTRLITGSTGRVEGKCSYAAFGTPTCEGTATTPLGYDGQYTSSDTGLIYMRARTYDPATAQFLSVDPASDATGARYSFALDNPLDRDDPTGRCSGFGPGLSGCAGSETEVGPHALCLPDRREVEEEERDARLRKAEAEEVGGLEVGIELVVEGMKGTK